MRVALFFLIALLSLTGCTAAVLMKNSQTGQIAKCGPYTSDIIAGGNAQAQREAGCVRDFQRQGYERMP